ncbi:MAG: dephospho-CoA kinase [Gammaproteobacteria bacterium]
MTTTGTAPDTPASRAERPLVIGLTGGIGSGKSTVAEGFQALGVAVIDADRIAHALVEPGQPALDAIVASFGRDCLTADGHLDRTRMRRRVFTDAAQRQRLEAILHPIIRSKIRDLIREVETAYCIVVIPLLLETGQTDLVDRILVVDVPEAVQIARVAARDGLSQAEISAIMATQADRASRLAAATDVISNDADRATLTRRIQALHAHFLELAGAAGPR